MKKKFAICLIALLAFGIISHTFFAAPALAANVEETGDKIRVFIGNNEVLSDNDVESYSALQADYLEKQITNSPDSITSALITFDDFLSLDELPDTLNDVESIDTVYIWMPGKDGRSIIDVQNNNINTTINTFFQTLKLDDAAPDYKADMIDLMEHYGVFALEIKSTYATLDELAAAAHIVRVDPIYSESAEILSARTNKPISYICIPEKPDGTH